MEGVGSEFGPFFEHIEHPVLTWTEAGTYSDGNTVVSENHFGSEQASCFSNTV